MRMWDDVDVMLNEVRKTWKWTNDADVSVCAVVDANGCSDPGRIRQRAADVDDRCWRTTDVAEPAQRRHAVHRRTFFRSAHHTRLHSVPAVCSRYYLDQSPTPALDYSTLTTTLLPLLSAFACLLDRSVFPEIAPGYAEWIPIESRQRLEIAGAIFFSRRMLSCHPITDSKHWMDSRLVITVDLAVLCFYSKTG